MKVPQKVEKNRGFDKQEFNNVVKRLDLAARICTLYKRTKYYYYCLENMTSVNSRGLGLLELRHTLSVHTHFLC